MSKQSKPGKRTVELAAPARPSRIRRDPLRSGPAEPGKVPWWATREWEIRLSIIGIILFALAINAIAFGINQVTS